MIPLLLLLAAPTVEIPAQAVRAHVEFLASDLVEGRETGTRGFDIAARYVAAQFAAAGLEPGGRDGWRDPVHLRSTELVPGETRVCLVRDGGCEVLEHRKDVMIGADPFRDVTDVEAPLVFAGFGVTAPELQHDDYAGLDVRGRIVVVLSGAPKRFPADPRAFHGSSLMKSQRAVENGAVGVLTLRTLDSESRYPWERYASLSSPVGMKALVGEKVLDVSPELRVSATLSHATAEKVFAAAPRPLAGVLAEAERGEPRPMPLAVALRAHVVSKRGVVESANVAGRLRGSDPARAGEYVVVTAHLDHLGILEQGEDRVRNGALDNASGSAALIEIARALASGPRPARSVLFLALTAEEKGLQGSRAFVEDPSVPVGSIVAEVNMDMLVAIFPLKALVPMGAEHSTLGPMAEEAARAAGWEIAPETEPEESHFVRSDQFSFIRKGVPALAFRGAAASADPSVDGVAKQAEWRRTVYHSATDDLGQPIDYPSIARWAAANLALVRRAADAPVRPSWNSGDFFGVTFAPKELDRGAAAPGKSSIP